MGNDPILTLSQRVVLNLYTNTTPKYTSILLIWYAGQGSNLYVSNYLSPRS